MKTKLFLIGLLAIFLSSFSMAATIEGSVSDNQTGTSISGAEVKLYKMGIIIRTVNTDKLGMFEFNWIEVLINDFCDLSKFVVLIGDGGVVGEEFGSDPSFGVAVETAGAVLIIGIGE